MALTSMLPPMTATAIVEYDRRKNRNQKVVLDCTSARENMGERSGKDEHTHIYPKPELPFPLSYINGKLFELLPG
jgi:hypothetical protein